MTTLYSLRTDSVPDTYTITKFIDGEVGNSYQCTPTECTCPAGHRPTCRHRQMLPTMLAHGIANTHWFMDWDRSGAIVDFQGGSKRLYDELAAAQTEPVYLEGPITFAPMPKLPAKEETVSKPQRGWRRL